MTLPEGMTVDPSAADGLRACSNAQFGLGSTAEPAEPAACPLSSQIGTVKIVTPLLGKSRLKVRCFSVNRNVRRASSAMLKTAASSGCSCRCVRSERGVIVKLRGSCDRRTRRRAGCKRRSQNSRSFRSANCCLTFNGGARASLANPQTSGPSDDDADLTPWSAPGLGGLSGTNRSQAPRRHPSSSFNVDWNGWGRVPCHDAVQPVL